MNEIDYMLYEGMTLQQVAARMQELKNKLDEATDIKTSLQKEYDHVRMNVIPGILDDQGVSTITLDDIGRISLTSDIFASIPSEFKDQAWDWLRENGHGDIIKETINAGTLKAVLKAVITKGEQLPEGLFKVTPFSRASITKVK
jgi:hypothetical protein